MVAINFREQFADLVRSGKKRQTIRRSRRNGQLTQGCVLQLYTGLRTKAAEKLVDPDPVCLKVTAVSINHKRISINAHAMPTDSPEARAFAKEDGFNNVEDMLAFFLKDGDNFQGFLIEW